MQEKERQYLENYDAHADALFRFAFFQVSDHETAHDIVQDVFMETWNFLVKGGEVENFKAFLYRATRNRIIDHYRKHKNRSLEEMQEKGADFYDERNITNTENTAEMSHLLRLFEQVEEKYKEPVLLRYVEGLGVKEISSMLGESENNTSVLIHRGLEQLKKLAHI